MKLQRNQNSPSSILEHRSEHVKYRWPKFYTGPQNVNCEAGCRAAGGEVYLGPRLWSVPWAAGRWATGLPLAKPGFVIFGIV